MIPENHIYTFSGVSFSPLSPCMENILAEDIAHALAYICRANGHFKSFYSVAQHCLACEQEARLRGLPREVRLACLLHDASEAFISDITRPVKRQLTEYKAIEKRLQDVIYRRFGVDLENSDIMAAVSEIDDAMLYHEFLALGGLALYESAPQIISAPDFSFVPFEKTEQGFLSTLNSLIKGE
ncbi:MAG: phosphohydrolase [Oscillospiraceae bacterium]